MHKPTLLSTLATAALGLWLSFTTAQAQTFETVFSDNQGREVYAGLLLANDGNFYGTTNSGGASDLGTVFKITTGGALTTLHSFNRANGSAPRAKLVQGTDGNFYGTTYGGGTSNYGTVFKITPSGEHALLHSFNGADGRYPEAGLVLGNDGNFYGTTYSGGASGSGTVFKITASGTHSVLHSFNYTNGSQPYAELVQGSDGDFYGTASNGGAHGSGAIFKITNSGAYTLLHNLSGANGTSPRSGLVQLSDGNFYGTNLLGGAQSHGTIFKITPSGTLTLLHTFNSANGSGPSGVLLLAADGNLYGTTNAGGANGLGTVFKIAPSGSHTLLHSFDSSGGRYPQCELVEGTDGSLYGTTEQSGGSSHGTVFKITTVGTITQLYQFNSANGQHPRAELLQGSDGSFYGTTYAGGTSNLGTVFKVTDTGTFTMLHSFNGPNGHGPRSGLVQGSDGNFYGTTYQGGEGNYGTVFKITASGTHTVLHSFNNGNGRNPEAKLVQGSDGNFYGTTYQGGVSGYGTVFKINASGTHTVLHSFSTSSNGRNPVAGLVQGSDGGFYGTTQNGGMNAVGTVYKITSSGIYTVLHSFNGTNGSAPYAELVQGSDGNFYGTTFEGGATGHGTVFKITASGTHTLLHNFNIANGNWVYGGLVLGSDGSFYGTTGGGGTGGYGTVFKITASGTHTLLHSFDGSSASSPPGTPTFGTDGNLYGTANLMVVWRLNYDATTTQFPTLTAPAETSSSTSPIGVSFTLPEAALAGSVKLAFGATELTLAASQETAGVHSFSFDPANPTASPEIASGSAIADGSYTVTLSYQDSAGNPAAQAQSTNVVVDTMTLSPILTAPVSGATYGNPVSVSFDLPESASPGSLKLSFGSTELTLASSEETAGPHSFTFHPANPAASPQIVSGAPIHNGTYLVELTYQDNILNPHASDQSADVTVAGVIIDPLFTTLHSKGGAVPNAGVVGSGIPAGAIWSKLGIPSINDAGHLAVLGDWAAGTVRGSSIFRGGPGAVTLQISLSKGAAVPGLTNVVLGTLKDPILGPDGSIAVVAGLANAPSTTGAVTTADNAALVLDADGSGAGGAVVIARKGTAAPGAGGALWKTFDSVAVGNNAVAILGKLSGGTITTLNDQCVWIYNRNTMTTTLALREGNALLGSTVKVIGALVARAAAGAQGRGVANDGTQDQVAVRVTLANGTVAVGAVDENGTFGVSYQTGGAAPGYVGATWKSFTLPGQNTVSAQAFVGVVQGGNATTATNTSLFTEDDSSFALSKRVTKGDAAPGFPGGVFGGFKDPVNGTGGAFAFVGSTAVSSSAGIASTSNDGVWYHDGSTLSLIARESTHPAGTTTGTNWKAFTSVALPNGRKPLFYATLVVGPGGVTTGSDTGIWAVDSLGQVKKLIQEGDAFGSSTVKSFKALLPLTGSPAQTRSFNNNGEVVMQVTDAAGGTHLLHVAVP